MSEREVELVHRAVLTPLGDLDATVAAIARGERAGARDRASQLVGARLSATPTSARYSRLVGTLPALALDVARRAAIAVPAGPRTGVFVATGGLRAQLDELAPALADQSFGAANAWARGLKQLHPLWMLRYLTNGAQAAIAAELGMLGDGATFAGPAAAASALVAAHTALATGVIDHALVVALDDACADEVAVELAARKPGLIPGAGIAAIALSSGTGGRGLRHAALGGRAVRIVAADGVDPDHAEPSAAAIAAVRERVPHADREVSYVEHTGWLGAATLLVDALIACEQSRGSATVTAAASPGQIGVIRVEVT